MKTVPQFTPARYRAIWLSDVHLGYLGCKAEYLLDFLKSTDSEVLYLLGDIVDIWSMKRTVYWPQLHNDILRIILAKAKHGTRVIYVPGNHDEQFRDFSGSVFGNIEIHREYIHQTPQGLCYLMQHGDEYDDIMQGGRLNKFVGNLGYDLLMYLNRKFNKLRRSLGFCYWSLASYLKNKVKNAVAHTRQFEQLVANGANKRGFDGVVCGHIHQAEIRKIDEVLYCNCGDWVENCTALVEHQEGNLEILHWSEKRETVRSLPTLTQPVAA